MSLSGITVGIQVCECFILQVVEGKEFFQNAAFLTAHLLASGK
jgi:hypothetical protein